MIYDLVIIGAGPAGAATAYHAAKNGINTLLLEENEKVGEPVHCGECLSDVAVKRLGLELPKEVISKKVKGVRTIFPNEKDYLLNEDGYVLEKEKFEQWLVGLAVENGCELKLNEQVIDVKKNKNWNIKTKNGSFESKILVDASGSKCFVSTKLGLNPSPKRVIGMQYLMEAIPNDGYLDFYLWPDLAPHGYLWVIPKKDGKANVGLVTTDANNTKKYLEEFCKKLGFENKKIVKKFGGLIPGSGPLQNTFDDSLLLVGDAAGFTSPLFEGGTSLSMTSGKFAAQVIKEALDANDFSKKMFSKYEKLWKKEFPPYDKLVVGKNALYHLTNEELSFAASFLPKDLTTLNLIQKVYFGLNVCCRRPSLISSKVFEAFLAFGYSRAKKYGW